MKRKHLKQVVIVSVLLIGLIAGLTNVDPQLQNNSDQIDMPSNNTTIGSDDTETGINVSVSDMACIESYNGSYCINMS